VGTIPFHLNQMLVSYNNMDSPTGYFVRMYTKNSSSKLIKSQKISSKKF